MSNCSILSESKSDYTCLTKKDLVNISNKLDINISYLNKKEIYNVLKKILGKNEKKWKLDFSGGKRIKEKIKYYTFKINGPLKSTAWITNTQIDKIMCQIVKMQHKKNIYNFIYFDTLSADFFILNPEKIKSVEQYLKKGKNVGIIFNNDVSTLPGSHWTSVYLTPKTTEFFDSNGEKPNKYIMSFLENFKNVSFNSKQYQMIDGDCGLWAITFLIKKISNKEIDSSDTDITVNKIRSLFFRKKE
jgi:hypothetical protein